MAKKNKITVKCDNCKATYSWIVPEGYDIDKDSVCKKCKQGRLKECKGGNSGSNK